MARPSRTATAASAGARRHRRPPKPASALEQLSAEEAQTVLHRLLAAHPDLGVEAEGMARSLVAKVDFEAVADDIEDALCALGLEALEGRAGRHHGGYTPPTEAAWELLQEEVDPFVADMKRQTEIGLEAEALETCKGILLGLYRVRERQDDELLGWAPDFPTETAAEIVRTLAGFHLKDADRKRHPRLHLEQEFVDKYIPKWRDLIARTLTLA